MDANHPHSKARAAESTILWLLSRFGYLTAAQVAELVYPANAQKLVMARRTLLRLNKNNLVLIRKGENVYSDQHYALAEAGARAVYQLRGVVANSGKDALREPSAHRDAANWSAMHLHFEGYSAIWTEREIQPRRAPFKRLGQKIPDFLGVDPEGYCTWGEVEASRRGGRDMQSLGRWLVHTAFPPMTDTRLVPLDPPRYTLFLSEVRFVIAAASAETFPQRLARSLRDHGGIEDPSTWAEGRLQFQISTDLNSKIVNGFPPSATE